MGLDVTKINPFNPSMQGARKVNPSQKPVEAIGEINKGSNPFAANNKNEQKGVGIVNSDLQNLSNPIYGKQNFSNTLGIA